MDDSLCQLRYPIQLDTITVILMLGSLGGRNHRLWSMDVGGCHLRHLLEQDMITVIRCCRPAAASSHGH